MGLSGPNWGLYGAYFGHFWSNQGLFGPNQSPFSADFGQLWAYPEPIWGPVLAYLVDQGIAGHGFGPFWTYFDPFGQFLPFWASSGTIWA